MSRVGKKPIEIPDGVEVNLKGNKLTVEGKRGELSVEIPDVISVEEKDGKVLVSQKRRTKRSAALWGLTRSLIQNSVSGVSEGFKKELEIQGIGYRASLSGDKLQLEVGYSHPVEMDIPKDIEIEVKKNAVTIIGKDKQRVGEFAANIRKVRPPEPYKGKGIRYLGEEVRRKEGKKAVSTE